MERSPRRKEFGNAKAESCTTRESRGFGFVAMGPVEDAEAVVTARNATELGSSWMCYPPHREGIMDLRSVMTVSPFSIGTSH
jgi:hypothetical protein